MLRTALPQPIKRILFLLLVGLLSACSFQLNPYSLSTTIVDLPFTSNQAVDEIVYDPRLERVIVPGGEDGSLALVDQATKRVRMISGFADFSTPQIVSVAVVREYLYALDQAAKRIYIIDAEAGQLAAEVTVLETPDSIRFVPTNNELWVTQKAGQQIEVFTITDGTPPLLEHSGLISVPGGPEGLVIDRSHGLAYTNQPDRGTTAVIQIFTRRILENWGNGCSQARDMAIDEQRGYLYVSCGEGKLVVMDLENHGAQLGSINYGGDLNGIAYNAANGHIYVPSAASAIVGVFAIQDAAEAALTAQPTAIGEGAAVQSTEQSQKVQLVRLGTADTGMQAGCVTIDSSSNLWVCDPVNGRLFFIPDTFPANQ